MIHRTVLSVLVLTVGLGGVVSRAESQATTTLNISILEPSPPITTSDVIRLEASTLEYVFPDTGHVVYSSFVVEGFHVDWHISSEMTGGPAYPVLRKLNHIEELAPLPAGHYEVTATWNHIGGEMLPGGPTSGIGCISFTVVPEPCTTVLFAAWCMILACFVRRRQSSRGQRMSPFLLFVSGRK